MPTPEVDSYVTLAEAEDYLAAGIEPEAWAAASESDRESALIASARLMDSLPWLGRRTIYDQPLAWPRFGIWIEGRRLHPDEIPEQVSRAQIELAAEILEGGILQRDELSRFERAQVGPISVTVRQGDYQGRVPAKIERILRGLLYGGGSIRLHRA